MIININLKKIFNPIVVILVTCALFSTDYFKISPYCHEIITNPIFIILTVYWFISLFIYKRKDTKRNDS